jgi:hypothetical protein
MNRLAEFKHELYIHQLVFLLYCQLDEFKHELYIKGKKYCPCELRAVKEKQQGFWSEKWLLSTLKW